MKTILEVSSNPRGHWVGDGFPVRSLFSYSTHSKTLSPFLLLDFAGPAEFTPAATPRGVGQHPHRGFETVTIVYRGEVSHRDSTGQGGTIGPGDVQWMTAGAGILHEEFHSEAFTRAGGMLQMIQLWVNLPARHKMTTPRYQAILNSEIPAAPLANGAGTVRVIAGQYENAKGPAHTFTPMNVWDLRLVASGSTAVPALAGWNTALIVLNGQIKVNNERVVQDGAMVVLSAQGSDCFIETLSDASVLLLSGEPIDEPVVGYGPFVMNTRSEIEQAIHDFNSGKFGEMPA
ncbi:MAG: pirin family protein [Betaproteobacteria bacterium]|jgi:redox-sensitive bicupin YhaK (pirin superfamily)|nr:pirin family protein [Betaproteobacteria bacterium]